jgi:hypothetical protein
LLGGNTICLMANTRRTATVTFQDEEGHWWRINPDRYYKDETGQWWRMASPTVRARCEVKVCGGCGYRFPFCGSGNPGTGRYCQRECANRATKPMRGRKGPSSPNWKGGRSVSKEGYVGVRVNGEYIAEHRYVISQHIGRDLLPEETVHHKNGVHGDNRLENLELWSSRHPRGQRIEDLVDFAIEILALYAPERLAPDG